MKEIKAYVRTEKIDSVIQHLEEIGITGMTVIDVSTIGSWADPEESRVSIEYCDKYCCSVKNELVCKDDDVGKIISVIVDNAHTGNKGDGKIFVSDIDKAISIRTKQAEVL